MKERFYFPNGVPRGARLIGVPLYQKLGSSNVSYITYIHYYSANNKALNNNKHKHT